METKKIIKWYPAVEPNMIPVKEGRRLILNDGEIAVFNLGNEYLAIENRCPHKQGPLADGIVSGKAVFCPLHNLKVSLENGCALGGGEGQVKTYPVKMIQGKVCIALEEGKYDPNCTTENLTEDQNRVDIH